MHHLPAQLPNDSESEDEYDFEEKCGSNNEISHRHEKTVLPHDTIQTNNLQEDIAPMPE